MPSEPGARGDKHLDPRMLWRVERMSYGISRRINARLRDAFGGTHIWVNGNTRVMNHLIIDSAWQSLNALVGGEFCNYLNFE